MSVTEGTKEAVIRELCSLLNITPTTDTDYNVSFQALGGNSLHALKLVSRCKKQGLSLAVSSVLQSKSLYEIVASVSRSDPLLEETVTEDGEQRLSDLASVGSGSYSSYETGSPKFFEFTEPFEEEDEVMKDVTDLAPASGLQLSFMHESIKNPGTNIIQHFEVYKADDIQRVKTGWETVWEQEAILRTRYSTDLTAYEATRFDWEEANTKDPKEFEQWKFSAPTPSMEEIGSSWKVVNLTGPTTNKSVVIWTIHHALIDGYSAQLLLFKMRMAASGSPISSGPTFSSISRQLQWLREENKADGDAFWEKQRDLHAQAAKTLQYPPPSNVPCLEDNSSLKSGRCEYGQSYVDLGAGWNQNILSGIAKRAGVTPAVIYHAAWALIMTVFADSDTICFGTALSGRNLPIAGVDEAVGPLLNTLPLALCIEDAETTLGDLARETQQRLNDLAQYSWTTPENGFSRNFQCALAMQFLMDDDSIALADEAQANDMETVRPVERPITKQTSDVPLNVLVDEAYDQVRLQYSLQDFMPCQVESLGSLYKHALQSFVRLHVPVSLVQKSLITPEAQRGLEQWGNCLSTTTSPLSVAEDLVTLFEHAVDQNPDSLAAQAGCREHLTYREMDNKATTIAAALCNDYDVQPGDVVCVDANRSLDWLVSIFGVLKTGAAYCAIDYELPQHLRSVIFARTGAGVFLASTSDVVDRRTPKDCPLALSVEELVNSNNSPRSLDDIRRRKVPMPESTAYVCFTSGSTGTPKGVVCTHQGLVAFQRDLQVRLFAEPGVKVAQVMSPAFDGSIHEIFSALCHGATLVLPPPGGKNVTETLSLAHSAILTPSLAEVLDPADYPTLKYVYLVGEPVKQAVNDLWGATKSLYNMYGPTEGTGGATIKRLLPGHPVTTGRPNPSSRVYILSSATSASQNLRLMPPGTVGEICVAGVQVARGYLGMPELTAERFVPDPFCKTGTGDYLYRTGDRGYWSPTGEIVCLGRNDRQIKLRGFRLDLNDLEARVLQATPGISRLKSVAIAQRGDHLVAALQPATLTLSSEAVSVLMTQLLPPYAQPRHVIFVDEWPMTRAGKLDYKALVSDEFIHEATQENIAARSKVNGQLEAPLKPLEGMIASVWREVLGLSSCESIERHSGFLQLGGDSLRQITMLAKLSSCLKTRLPLKIIIESRTLGELATRLEEFDPNLSDLAHFPYSTSSSKSDSHLKAFAIRPPCTTQLSPVELDWWVRYRMHPDSYTSTFNVSFVASLSADVDHSALCRALDTVISRYSLFRGRYVPVVGRGRGDQSYGLVERRYVEQPPQVHRLRHLYIWAEVNKPFDLEREPPIRMFMTDNTMAIVTSHIVADLTTLNIVLREVGILYQGKTLPPMSRSYEQETVPAMWNYEPSPCDLQFWTQYLGSTQSGDNARPKRIGYRGTSRLYRLSSGLATRMLQFCADHKNGNMLSLQQLTVAAVGLATSALQERGASQDESKEDRTDVVLGIPFINRSSTHDMEAVGLFLEPLPVRVRYTAPKSDDANDAQDFLDSVRASAIAAVAHAVPWHKFVAQTYPACQQQQTHPSLASLCPAEPDAPFETMVTFHHADNSVRLDIPGVVPRMTWADGAKFSLMTEFTALENGSVVLRAEYDTQRYATGDVDRIVSATAAAIDMLIASERSIAEIKQSLRGASPVLDCSLISVQENAFGICLKDLASPCPSAQPEPALQSMGETKSTLANDRLSVSKAEVTSCKRAAETIMEKPCSKIAKRPPLVGARVR